MISNIRSITAPRHLDADELARGLAEIRRSPKDGGTVVMIVIRPAGEERICLEKGELSPEDGLHGDRWHLGGWGRAERDPGSAGVELRRAPATPTPSPDPAVQITLMNARCIQLLAGDRAYWSLAGDNLFVDLDLSIENLPAGAQLRIGECILEIAQPPHTGCAKFKRRFGLAALQFVNSPEGKALRLRGANARVLQPGIVTVGDMIQRAVP
jgi:MOSC domain